MKDSRRSFVGVAVLALASLVIGCASTESGDVESRGLRQKQQPMQLGAPTQSGAPGQPTAQLPTFPQKFDVQGPESDSFGFAVTQPGPVVVDVQVQGAPVIVTLQGPAPQPISQQGTGQIRLTYNATPQDVQNAPCSGGSRSGSLSRRRRSWEGGPRA